MHNRYLPARTARDIDTRVAKVLKDLGQPEPPLRLEYVREQLRLDKAFYSSSDTSAITETVHRMKVAGQQVIQRPALLWDAIRKLDIKALWVPDRKRILIDAQLPSAKQRWGEAHEIGHSLIPWHEMVMHGDKQLTLRLACEEQTEAEANYAAGRLLFLQDAFLDHFNGSALNFEHVQQLHDTFGNTITSTLWRAVETAELPVFGLVSQHPQKPLTAEPLRYFIRSPRFLHEFSHHTAMQLFTTLQSFCFGRRGPIGQSEILLTDSNGQHHVFFVEAFNNHYDVLTLGVYRRVRVAAVAV